MVILLIRPVSITGCPDSRLAAPDLLYPVQGQYGSSGSGCECKTRIQSKMNSLFCAVKHLNLAAEAPVQDASTVPAFQKTISA